MAPYSWALKKRKRHSKQRTSRRSSSTSTYDLLEPRQLLAFTFEFVGGALVLNQTVDDGAIIVDNLGASLAYRVTDASGTTTLGNAGSLIVNLLDDTGNRFDLDLDNEAGQVALNLGNGDRVVNFSGDSNAFLGTVEVNGGTGDQFVALAVNHAFSTEESLNIRLGSGNDTVDDAGHDITVFNSVLFQNVNFFQNESVMVVGNEVVIDNVDAEVESTFDNDGTLTVLQDFTYVGGDQRDIVKLNGPGGTKISGATAIVVGNNVSTFPQEIHVNSVESELGNGLNVISTASNSLDDFILGVSVEVSHLINVDLGDGPNSARFLGTRIDAFGAGIRYFGGSGVDEVYFGTTGWTTGALFHLGQGNDHFTIDTSVQILLSLRVEFGNNIDTFINNLGRFNFDAYLNGLDGFDHTYFVAADELTSEQISVSASHVNFLFEAEDRSVVASHGWSTSLMHISSLTVTLLGNEAVDLSVTLNETLPGNLRINLGDGGRTFLLDGSVNRVERSLQISGGAGDQSVHLAEAQSLHVETSLSVVLEGGFDTVDVGGNDLYVSLHASFNGINQLQSNSHLQIGGDLTVDAIGDSTASLLEIAGTFSLGGNFLYYGSHLKDELRFSGAGIQRIQGNMLVELGDNLGGGAQVVHLGSAGMSIGGKLDIRSISAVHSDGFFAHPDVNFEDDISIDLGDGQNDATFNGSFYGDSVTYVGGAGVDSVEYALNGLNSASTRVTLGGGDDVFTLNPGANSARGMTIDFGGNLDQFVNHFGSFTFNVALIGLDGFSFEVLPSADTIKINQVSAQSPLTIIDQGGSLGAWRLINDQIVELMPASNLRVSFLDGGYSDLHLKIDQVFSGDLEIGLGHGERSVHFIGTNNSIQGNLAINAGTGSQFINLAENQMLSVGGEFAIDLGADSDSILDSGNGVSAGQNWILYGVNEFENRGAIQVAGDLLWDSSDELLLNVFRNLGRVTVTEELVYLGSLGRDEILMNDGASLSVLGDVSIDMNQNFEGGTDIVWLGAAQTNFGGELSIVSPGDQADDLRFGSTGLFNGNISIDLGGGHNRAHLVGLLDANSVTYEGGSGSDEVNYGMTGEFLYLNTILGAGDDSFTLSATANVGAGLRVDFGSGGEEFVNSLGKFNFNAALLNFDGFHRYYKMGLDQWHFVQLADHGDVLVDQGADGAIGLTHSIATELSHASTVRVNLLSHSGDLAVELSSPLEGDLIVNLGHGGRAISLTGADNSIGGNLIIDSADGNQTVDLAVNQGLTVGGSAVFNLRRGVDTVKSNGHDVDVGESFIFRGVNEYMNDGDVRVGAILMNTSFEVEEARLHNNGTIEVVDSLIYIGGSSHDDVFLDNGVSVGGHVSLDLGRNLPQFPEQIVSLTGFHASKSVTVLGGTSLAGNHLVTDAETRMEGYFSINFQDNFGVNEAMIAGTYLGPFSFYRGGTGRDKVQLDVNAGDSNFYFQLNNGQDEFHLANTNLVNRLVINFGFGDDKFVDEFDGNYPFGTFFSNLP